MASSLVPRFRLTMVFRVGMWANIHATPVQALRCRVCRLPVRTLALTCAGSSEAGFLAGGVGPWGHDRGLFLKRFNRGMTGGLSGCLGTRPTAPPSGQGVIIAVRLKTSQGVDNRGSFFTGGPLIGQQNVQRGHRFTFTLKPGRYALLVSQGVTQSDGTISDTAPSWKPTTLTVVVLQDRSSAQICGVSVEWHIIPNRARIPCRR